MVGPEFLPSDLMQLDKSDKKPGHQKSTLYLKLLVDKENNRVLFAEAGKEFVDFLFGLLRMRVGSMVSLLEKQSMVGSMDNLYESLENLNSQYVLNPHENMDALLQPRSVPRFLGKRIKPLLTLSSKIREKPEPKKFFTCPDHIFYGSPIAGGKCPKCDFSFSREVEVVEPKAARANIASQKKRTKPVGFVKKVVKYMITEDLSITPLSAISGLNVVSKFNINDLCKLEERTVKVGLNEAKNLAEAALQSQTPLTDVFLPRAVT